LDASAADSCSQVFHQELTAETCDLLEQALKLDPMERLNLVGGVPRSLDRPDPTIDRVWLYEAERRLAAYRKGRTRGVPAEDVVGPI